MPKVWDAILEGDAFDSQPLPDTPRLILFHHQVVECPAPSVTFGGSFCIHDLAAGAGSLRLMAITRVKVS